MDPYRQTAKVNIDGQLNLFKKTKGVVFEAMLLQLRDSKFGSFWVFF